MALDIGTLARNNRQIGIQLELWANRVMDKEQITGYQSQVLLYILRHAQEGASLTAIHHAYGYSKATLSGLIKQLREKGYVRVEHCTGDDRRKLLYATDRGKQIMEALSEYNRQAQGWLDRNFSPEELGAIERLQGKMLQKLIAANECKQKEASEHEKSDKPAQAI